MMCVRRLLGKPPRSAHGRRTADGSYFSIWLCQHGHGGVGSPSAPPETCLDCAFSWSENGHGWPLYPSPWRLASRTEARSFIYNAAGADVFRGVGFEVLR